MLDALADERIPTPNMGQIRCFVVAREHRRTGVAKALLQAACAGLKEQGFTIAEASPLRGPSSDAENHYGPLAMYLDAGFTVHRTGEDGTVYIRREL